MEEITMEKTNLDALLEGVKHIAHNHKCSYYDEWMEDGHIGIYGDSIPLLGDVEMLCEDCKLSTDAVEIICGMVSIEFLDEWMDEWMQKPYEQPIHEFWRRMA